jgi:hypothetical protein
VYLGYHPGMSRANAPRRLEARAKPPHALLLALAGALTCACASKIPDVAPLCGTWADGAGVTERWWVDGKGLRGEGQTADEAGEVHTTEVLELVHSRDGHIYVARPGGAAPTEFAPIDPALARFPLTAPATSDVWVWANYEHDFPQEIHYAVIDNHLHAKIVGPGDAGESSGQSMGWTLERTAACGEESRG